MSGANHACPRTSHVRTEVHTRPDDRRGHDNLLIDSRSPAFSLHGPRSSIHHRPASEAVSRKDVFPLDRTPIAFRNQISESDLPPTQLKMGDPYREYCSNERQWRCFGQGGTRNAGHNSSNGNDLRDKKSANPARFGPILQHHSLKLSHVVTSRDRSINGWGVCHFATSWRASQ